ncbi:hypothetical protein THRCLA_21085 [Thraustotheca clavata]|uniref:RUN domain-containing protein n=1 Tax=Thraustotheca clavata TaxID=74557 RepID=A0A1W0A0E3_9STRA|nr:hypothetical protein THRCLA_21085 [Thraustotheca clavata]
MWFSRLILFGILEIFIALCTLVLLTIAASFYELISSVKAILNESSVPMMYIKNKMIAQKSLLHLGFRTEAIRKQPPSAYLHTTFGLDKCVAEELGTLVNIIVGDFVQCWYKQLTSEDQFITGVKVILCDIFGQLTVRCKEHFAFHGAMTFATDMLAMITLHLAAFREIYAQLANNYPSEFQLEDDLESRKKRVLEHLIQTPHLLHRGCHDSTYLKNIAMQILAICRPDFDVKHTLSVVAPVSTLCWHFMGEIFAKCVFEPILAYSEPRYSNALVVNCLPWLSEIDATSTCESYTASHARRSPILDKKQLEMLWAELETNTYEWNKQDTRGVQSSSSAKSSNVVPPTTISRRTTSSAITKMKSKFRRCNSAPKEIVEPQVEATAGQVIVKNLVAAIDGILEYLEISPTKCSARTCELHALISALEQVLLFGLKPSAYDFYYPFLMECRPQVTFWQARIDQIENLPRAQVSRGHYCSRGIQWLLIALEDGELWAYFTALTLTTSLTELYYEPYAILRDCISMETMVQALFRLSDYQWQCDIDVALGREWSGLSYELESIIDEAWESERYLPLQGWVKSSDKRKRYEKLPSSEWIWVSEWKLVSNDTADKNHWQYSKTSKDGFHDKEKALDCVRRRKWQRMRTVNPLILVPIDDTYVNEASNQATTESSSPEKLKESICFLCCRQVVDCKELYKCPSCNQQCCFLCSSHCIKQEMPENTTEQRVCSQCYQTNLAKRRLRLTISSVEMVAGNDNNNTSTFQIIVKSTLGSEWHLVKRWSEFEILMAALETSDDIDIGQLRLLSLSKVNEADTEELIVYRFLLELLKCETLSQNILVQQFFLDSTDDVPTMPPQPAPRNNQNAKLGQMLMQKLELQAFKAFDEIFELQEVARLRRHVVSMTRTFFRISFNSACHRIVGAQFTELTQPRKIANHLYALRAAILSTEQNENVKPTPSIIDQTKACREALLQACPPVLVSVLGEQAAHNGNLKLFEFLQHELLVKSLLLSLLELLLTRLFPEIKPNAPKSTLFT